MNREELTALRDAIDLTLALPDSIRVLLAQWLHDDIAKPNGRDPHPPPIASKPAKTTAKPAKPSSGSAKTAEKKHQEVGDPDRSPGRTVPAPPFTPWVLPISEYERRETTVVEGCRFG